MVYLAKKIIQISGRADSNIFFPEINFWSHYKGIGRLKIFYRCLQEIHSKKSRCASI